MFFVEVVCFSRRHLVIMMWDLEMKSRSFAFKQRGCNCLQRISLLYVGIGDKLGCRKETILVETNPCELRASTRWKVYQTSYHIIGLILYNSILSNSFQIVKGDCENEFAVWLITWIRVNDPSAGSPTERWINLLLRKKMIDDIWLVFIWIISPTIS